MDGWIRADTGGRGGKESRAGDRCVEGRQGAVHWPRRPRPANPPCPHPPTTDAGYPGWTSILPEPSYVTDGTVAMMGALALFVIPRRDFFRASREARGGHAPLPAEEKEEKGVDDEGDPRARSDTQASTSTTSTMATTSTTTTTARHRPKPRPPSAAEPFGVLPWELALRRMPWNVLWLVGGGLALSLAFKESKLSRLIATAFGGVDRVPFPVVVFSVVVVRVPGCPASEHAWGPAPPCDSRA